MQKDEAPVAALGGLAAPDAGNSFAVVAEQGLERTQAHVQIGLAIEAVFARYLHVGEVAAQVEARNQQPALIEQKAGPHRFEV